MPHRAPVGRRAMLLSLAAAPAVLMHAGARAATGFPTRSVRIVVPFTPGGGNDVLARVLGDKLGAAWGQPVVIENRPGAAGNIGTDVVAKSPPDGYTLLIAANNILAMNPAMYAHLPFDPVRDLQSISLLGTLPILLVAGPGFRAGSVKEMVALAKAKPGGITFASSGAGSPQHLAGELFRTMTGIEMTHVPYKGAAPAITDLLGGQVDVLFGPINALLPQVRAGRLQPIGVAGPTRAPSLPDVPTIAEQGLPGYDSDIWIGLCMPARAPAALVEQINREVRRAMALPDVKQQLAEQGIQAAGSTPAEMSRLVASDAVRWSKLIKQAGIRAD